MNPVDENVFNDEVFGVIEPALEAAEYTIMDGDNNTSCVCSPDGTVHFQIKLVHV